MPNIQHRDIPEAQLHETKGASTSTAGHVLTSIGGTAVFAAPVLVPGSTSQGVYDYNDLTTASTPIPLTLAATRYKLTNDKAGAFTNTTYSLAGLDDVWVAGATNHFDWTNGTKLALGDTVDLRVDVEFVTSTNNTEIKLDLDLGVGDAGAYTLPLIDGSNVATAGTTRRIIQFSIYMGDTTTLDFPAEIYARASKTGTTVKVNGWFVRVLHTNT
jgi:hypothetical protein